MLENKININILDRSKWFFYRVLWCLYIFDIVRLEIKHIAKITFKPVHLNADYTVSNIGPTLLIVLRLHLLANDLTVDGCDCGT